MRQAVIDIIYNYMKKNENSFFLTGDLGYNTLEKIQKDFPNRFINVGIAEQNMIGIAAGLAKDGNKVFVYSIIPFLTMRCFEQIRNDLCYHNCDVILLGTGAGLSYGILGSTHFALEDVAIMAALPKMAVFSPCDEMEAVLGINELLNNWHGPVYFRIGKKKEPTVHQNSFPLKIGQGIVLKEGKNTTIFATGSLVSESLLAAENLKKEGIAAAVVDIHTLKPIDKHLVIRFCQNKKVVFSVEEHGIFGGLGTLVAQIIADEGLGTKLVRIGTDGNFVKLVGSQAYLREKLGLDAKGIAEKIKSSIL